MCREVKRSKNIESTELLNCFSLIAWIGLTGIFVRRKLMTRCSLMILYCSNHYSNIRLFPLMKTIYLLRKKFNYNVFFCFFIFSFDSIHGQSCLFCKPCARLFITNSPTSADCTLSYHPNFTAIHLPSLPSWTVLHWIW